MARTVAIGGQDFSKIIENDDYYVDKTNFIKEWWENGDTATLITRPRRFGKTLTMRMVEQIFLWNMQEAYVNGYWDDFVDFTRGLFHSTFKTNQFLERGIMTGITRVSKESIFSDLNNLEEKY